MKKLLLLTAILAFAPYLLAQESPWSRQYREAQKEKAQKEAEEKHDFDEPAPEPEPWPRGAEKDNVVSPWSKQYKEAQEEKARKEEEEKNKASNNHSFSIGGFYGIALQDLYDDLDKIDIYGAKIAYDFPAFDASERLSVAPFIEALFGYGDNSENVGYRYDLDITIIHYEVAAGLRWRYQCTKNFALTTNVKIGFDAEYLEIEEKYYSDTYKEDDTAVGFLWGAGIAAEFVISRDWGAFVGVDYVGSTAKPDFDEYTDPDAQSYVMFSAGLIARF